MNVKNVKHNLNHYKATAVFIAVTDQLNAPLFRLEKIAADWAEYLTIPEKANQ